MVARSFAAFDNEALTVVSSSNGSLVGDPIINNSNTPIGTVFQFSNSFPYQTITLEDTNDVDVFNDNDPGNHIITDGGTLVANGTEVESESYHWVRQLDEFGNPFGPEIQINVFSKDGDFTDIWGMSASAELVDGAQYVKVAGTNNGDSDYDTFVPCFTVGTLIVTARGEVAVEDLREGDRVVTRDNGLQEIRWIGSCDVTAARLDRDPALQPILVRKGAFGDGLPERDTYFSPNHRVLLNQPEISLHFGESEVFAAAKDLTARGGIEKTQTQGVTYVHLLFDQHEAVVSNGLWSESFLPGKVAMKGLGRQQKEEIEKLFPELIGAPEASAFLPARRIARSAEMAAPFRSAS